MFLIPKHVNIPKEGEMSVQRSVAMDGQQALNVSYTGEIMWYTGQCG